MSIADKILSTFFGKKFGTDFEEKVMKYLESQTVDQGEIVSEIIAHYESILQLLCPKYQSVRLDRNDLLKIYINDIEYNLDDTSSAKGRRAVEHRMAVECLLSDAGDAFSDVMTQVEKHFHCR